MRSLICFLFNNLSLKIKCGMRQEKGEKVEEKHFYAVQELFKN